MELHTVCPFTFKYSPVTNLGNIGNENLRKFRGEKIRDFLPLHFVHESGAYLYRVYMFILSPVLKGLCTNYSFEYSTLFLGSQIEILFRI